MHVAWGGWPRAWPAGNLVNVYTRRSEVEVERPLGMVLASRPNGKGVVVEELVDGGNAQKSRKVRRPRARTSPGLLLRCCSNESPWRPR